MPQFTTVREAVAEHVHERDALHLVVGHTRWSAAAREVVRQWWGRDPHFTLGDAQPVEPRRVVLPRRARRPRDHGLLGRHVPELHAEPLVPEGLPVRRRRGRALVVPRVHPAARGGGAGPARDHDALDRRLVDGRERCVHEDRHAVRRGGPARPADARRRDPARAGGRRAGERRGLGATARRRLGRARREAGCDRHRRAGRAVAPRLRGDGPHPGAPGAGGVRGADGRAPGRSLHRRTSGRRLRRGLRLLGRRPGRDAKRRLRRVDRAVDPRPGDAGGVPRPARRGPGRRAAGESRPGVVEGRRGAVPARPRRAGERVGGRRDLRRPSPRGPGRRARRGRGARGRRRREPRGVARRRSRPGEGLRRPPHRRDRAVGLRADPGRPVRAEPSQLPVRHDARRRRDGAADARRRSGDDDDRVPRRGAGRSPRQRELDRHPGWALPRRLGRWQRRRQRRGRGRGRRDAHAAAHAERVRLRHVTRSGGARARDRPGPAREADVRR